MEIWMVLMLGVALMVGSTVAQGVYFKAEYVK